MAVKKKSAAKKSVKAAPKKAAPKVAPKAAAPVKAITAKQTKTQIMAAIADATGLPKKDVGAVFTTMAGMVEAHMKRNGSGEFTIPEVGVKIRRHKKPATKARKMISPFTGEQITVKAKPARNSIKLTALKGLKEVVA